MEESKIALSRQREEHTRGGVSGSAYGCHFARWESLEIVDTELRILYAKLD